MMNFCKVALRSVAAVAAMGVFMYGVPQTAEAEAIFSVAASKMLPVVIANDSSQAIAKLLVRDRDADRGFDSVNSWDKVENSSAYDMGKGIVLNIAPGQWAQYNISQNKRIVTLGDDDGTRLVDVQVTLADGRVLELDKIDIYTRDVVLTDTGLMSVSIAKKPSSNPAYVQADGYFHNQQPQGRKAAEPRKDIPQGYVVIDGELVKWGN